MSPAEMVTVQVFHLCRAGASGTVTVHFANGHSDVGYWWASGRWPELNVGLLGMEVASAQERRRALPPIYSELHRVARLAGFLNEG